MFPNHIPDPNPRSVVSFVVRKLVEVSGLQGSPWYQNGVSTTCLSHFGERSSYIGSMTGAPDCWKLNNWPVLRLLETPSLGAKRRKANIYVGVTIKALTFNIRALAQRAHVALWYIHRLQTYDM